MEEINENRKNYLLINLKKWITKNFACEKPWLYFVIFCLITASVVNLRNKMFVGEVLADGFLLLLFGGVSWSLLNMWIEEDKKIKEEKCGKIRSDYQKIEKENEEIINQAYRLIFSSTRPMPAHFCGGDGERKKSFEIRFEQLNEKDEYNMASEAYNLVEDFYKNPRNTTERTWIVRLGEDAMVGAYIISKLGRPGLSFDLEKRIVRENADRFRGQSKDLDVDFVLKEVGVRMYLNFCVERGRAFATGIK